jgi:serine phosphatase RsbU (regulator of sigma subunit)/anti-sigma regulatory factor (Ser/Thr protein kinase)
VAIFIADVDHADIMNPILREKGIRSLLGVPLIVEGELIGVLHIGSLQPRNFDLRDLAILELAAARAAPAIERGRLLGALEREHRNAVILQRSLLPRRLIAVPGVTVAARYLPAREEVGGDWYDTVELLDGRVGIAIGDVVGHGLGAASLMGQLRTAMRAYALNGNGPARTLGLVNEYARSLDDDAMATAVYAVVDMKRAVLTFASAAHLPPLVIANGEAPHPVEVPPAPPIGAFDYTSWREHELSFGAGDSLVFYTDGLVERRGTPLRQSIELLVETLRDVHGPEELCLTAMDRLIPRMGPADDVAVIALQLEVPSDVLDLEWPARPTMLARVRQQIERWSALQGLDRTVATEVIIAVNEACANAIEHAYGPGRGTFAVHAERVEDWIEVRVSDTGQWRSPRHEARGRGLSIMRAAMDKLDVRAADDGTEVIMRRAV